VLGLRDFFCDRRAARSNSFFYVAPFIHNNHGPNMASWHERIGKDQKLVAWLAETAHLEPDFRNGLMFLAMLASGPIVESDFVKLSVSISPSA